MMPRIRGVLRVGIRGALRLLPAMAVVFSAGCSALRSSPPTEACVTLQAPERLNWFRGAAHTVHARVFALSATDAFNATDVEALSSEPPPFLPGVEGMPQSRSLHPETETTFRFKIGPQPITSFGVVAGYYKPLNPSKVSVPAREDKECAVLLMGESGFPAE